MMRNEECKEVVVLGKDEESIDCSKLDLDSYEKYLKMKMEPHYRIIGKQIIIKKHPERNANLSVLEAKETHLFDYQHFIVNEAVHKERYAIFADCGLGKTAMFLAWIRRILPTLEDKKVLIISPLMVISQTLDEEEKFYHERTIADIHGESVEAWARNPKSSRVAITNFDKFHEVRELGGVGAIVLDESSILKNGDGKTRNGLVESTRGIRWKLCCSATPAPNDREEYANHAAFLEYVRSNNEFYSMFFVNRDNGWEIKPHGLESFYQYLSTWSVFLRSPERYGFEDNLANLPKPVFETIDVPWTEAQKENIGLTQHSFKGSNQIVDAFERRRHYVQLSKGFIKDVGGNLKRVPTQKYEVLRSILSREVGKPTIVWAIFNEEQKRVIEEVKSHGLRVASIEGATSEEDRVRIVREFREGLYDVLVSKPRLLGFGINLPFATVQVFNGMTDSYEQFYQCVKRSHRFGATESIHVYLPVTEAEKQILENVLRKKETYENDARHQEDSFIANLQGELNTFFKIPYKDSIEVEGAHSNREAGRGWEVYRGDSIKVLRNLPAESVDFSVFSPPFASLFTYSNDIADMGNSRSSGEFYLQFEFFLEGLHHVMKPGRLVCCHLSQLATLKSKEGYIGLHDFRGDVIDLFQGHGFVYFGEWCIAKNPQMQAIKEKVRTLSFAQLESNRLVSKPGLNDYILIFKKRGDSLVKLNDRSGPSRDEWIEWATGVWTGIRESNTLNVRGTKSEDDVKHICPMNLQVIRRCVRMYSGPDEVVLDPFMGIGSTGVCSLELGRKFMGIELKQEYFDWSVKNLLEVKPDHILSDFYSEEKKGSNLNQFIGK